MRSNVWRKRNLFLKILKTMRMRQQKRDILLTEIETEGKWQKRNKRKQTYFLRKKRETITRRVKQGDTQKGKIEKTNKKRPNKDMKNHNEEKRSKRRR